MRDSASSGSAMSPSHSTGSRLVMTTVAAATQKDRTAPDTGGGGFSGESGQPSDNAASARRLRFAGACAPSRPVERYAGRNIRHLTGHGPLGGSLPNRALQGKGRRLRRRLRPACGRRLRRRPPPVTRQLPGPLTARSATPTLPSHPRRGDGA